MRQSVTAAGSALISGVVMFFAGRAVENHDRPAAQQDARTVVAEGRIATPEGPPGRQSAAPADGESRPLRESRPIAAAEMPDAIRAILLDPDPIAGLERFSALLRNLTPENAEAAWKALEEQADGRDATRYLPLLSHAWGRIDGAGAMKALSEIGGRESMMGRAGVMGGWAAQDPQAALAWLREHEADAAARRQAEGEEGGRRGRGRGGEETRILKAGMINGLARSDPAAAMAMLETMSEAERGPLVSVVAQAELKRGVEHAARWAESVSDPAMRKQAVAEVVREYSREDPAAAAAWLSSTGAGDASPSAAGTVAREWVSREPEKAVEWIGSLSDGEAKQAAYQEAFRTWGWRDPTASSTYLTRMPEGPSRDAAISSFARTVVREDPAAAIQWADAISDEAVRMDALVRTAQAWHARDPQAAGQWIASSGLPPDMQQTMMQQQPQQQFRRGGGPQGGRGRGGVGAGGGAQGGRGRGGFDAGGGRGPGGGGLRSRGGRG